MVTPEEVIPGHAKDESTGNDNGVIIVGVELPHVVELTVTDTAPVAKGATVTNQQKDAEMETGLKVRVPPFITIGEVLRVDTRTGDYVERA